MSMMTTRDAARMVAPWVLVVALLGNTSPSLRTWVRSALQTMCWINAPNSFRTSLTAASSRFRASSRVCPCFMERVISDMVMIHPTERSPRET